ncbi:hypothetical protein ASPVEDRAFT_394821 [Aspergillus versicolor CBS 583.65]|uniref:Uncharacterized protein n=1 Tax=Aspergillus versicolor CBS 583.65 TaxID=1036611 RepID=A0A1L9Q3N0_ASPVE|nr:uncharacterized protein ASPVEDRAFT_394821 [Aspergillus versicolor CBS 583.65]OJJ08370.1 hypothetical protein ASPVEDRAFT_394821 [Aspergillus versicolor CBS 583.65]
MAIIRPRHTVEAPATNLLSYIFDSPYKNEDEGAWPDSEPLLVPASSKQETGRISGYTITQLASLTKRIGNGLHQLETSGKRAMVYGDANFHFPLAVLGVIASGAACNVLPPCPVYYLVERLRQLECDTVLFAPGDIDTVYAAAKELGIPTERLFVVDEALTGNGNYGIDRVRHWSYLLDTPGGDTYKWPNLSPSESKSTTALLLFTSGPGCRTTGASKLAERSHYALIGNILATLHHYTLRPRLREIIFCNYKFCGMGFLTLGLLIPLKARYKCVFPFPLEPGAGAQSFVESIKRWKPSWVMAPKHLMRETLAMQDVTREDLASVHHVLTGGAIIPWELVAEWQGRFGSQVQSTYGMTEAGFYTIPDPTMPVEDATTGVLLPSVEAKIVDEEGNVLPRNEKGNVYTRTPFVMEGYLNDPVNTAQTIMEDGWVRTGDIGWADEEGRFYIVGRRKDLFKIKGNNVTAAEIETAILRNQEIKDVAVIPVVLPGDEEPAPRGYIVKKEHSKLTADELILWMQRELPPRMQLVAGAAFIDTIPISSVGNSKVDRQKLCDLAASEMQN